MRLRALYIEQGVSREPGSIRNAILKNLDLAEECEEHRVAAAFREIIVKRNASVLQQFKTPDNVLYCFCASRDALGTFLTIRRRQATSGENVH